MVILETLLVRRDVDADLTQGSTHTRLLVQEGDVITPGSVVARTEIQAKKPGIVQGIPAGAEAVRRVLVVTEEDQFKVPFPTALPGSGSEEVTSGIQLHPGDLVRAGDSLLESGGMVVAESGQLLQITPEAVVFRLARPYLVSSGAILQVANGDLVQRGDSLALLVFERAKTGDIIQGLPRIEELLEARKPKEMCVLATRPGTVQLTRKDDDVDIKIVESDGTVTDYPLLPGQNPIVMDGQKVEVSEPLTDGPANPHDLLESIYSYYKVELGADAAAQLALREVQRFFVNEVQSVYRSQGVEIADKHIEVVVRQMTSKVRVDDGGDTIMLPGEMVDLREIQQGNATMAVTGGAPAQYTPVLLGITKASLSTDSFISAASFQETTRVLTEAAIEGKSDWLRGLKENVIIGRLIPAGTGFSTYEEIASEPEPLEDEVLSYVPEPPTPRILLEDDQLIDDTTSLIAEEDLMADDEDEENDED